MPYVVYLADNGVSEVCSCTLLLCCVLSCLICDRKSIYGVSELVDPTCLMLKRRKWLGSVPTGGWLCLGAHVITARHTSIAGHSIPRSSQELLSQSTPAGALLSTMRATCSSRFWPLAELSGYALFTRNACLGTSAHTVCHCTEYTGVRYAQCHSREGQQKLLAFEAAAATAECPVWPQCDWVQTRGIAQPALIAICCGGKQSTLGQSGSYSA